MEPSREPIKLWPHNLYYAVFGKYYPLPENWEAEIEHILNLLTEREREFLTMRYRYGLTLQSIGDSAGLTKERVRQIISKILVRLRKRDLSLILLYGRGNYPAEKEEQDEEERQRYLQRIAAKYGEGSPELEAAKNFSQYSIEDLNLSVRTKNCLIKCGYEYLDELLPFDEDRLLKIRNFGVGSLNEIKLMMTKLDMIEYRPYVPPTLREQDESRRADFVWPKNLLNGLYSKSDLQWRTVDVANVEAALSTLSSKYRDILYTRYKEGLSRADAAKKYGIAESTVRTYERYAFMTLRSIPRTNIIFQEKAKD